MAYACLWIIIAYLELIFPPKNFNNKLSLPQMWVIYPVLKIAIAPDLICAKSSDLSVTWRIKMLIVAYRYQFSFKKILTQNSNLQQTVTNENMVETISWLS